MLIFLWIILFKKYYCFDILKFYLPDISFANLAITDTNVDQLNTQLNPGISIATNPQNAPFLQFPSNQNYQDDSGDSDARTVNFAPPEHLMIHSSGNQEYRQSEKKSFDSTPTRREFTSLEVELRPHLIFLERYKDGPELKSCVRLEGVPPLVYAERLCSFLGVQLNSPSENIARMQNGVLYINLGTEQLAAKSASITGGQLDGKQIFITQLTRAEMANAIRQNMIIIREIVGLPSEVFILK